MRCSNCNSIAKSECRDCKKWVCRMHCYMIFDEETRSFASLCGACYSQQRRIAWAKERS